MAPKITPSRVLTFTGQTAPTRPSVFLTDEGGLELAWEDAMGSPVQVDFNPRGFEFYREATGEEWSGVFDNLQELVRRLSV